MTDSTPILHYGKGAGGAVVDVDALVRGRGLIQANSGGGKSWALRQLLEETFGQVQHLVIDPEGEFATLREKYDYVLAAKSGGDVEASARTARMLCRRLMETSASAVLDLYDLKPNERREFARLFLTELLALPKDLRRPLLVVLDEAHTFAPEGAHSEAAEAVVTLAAQGRKRGYALICATQRLSKLSKDVAAELNTKLIGRTGLDLDVKRAGDELGMDKERRQSLATLEPGTFWAYGPALPAGPPRLVRTGDVETSHPEVGELAAPAPPPSKKVKALLAASLADLPKEAETEARTLDDLRKQNADLSRKLRTAERAQGQPTERVVTKPVVDQAAIDRAVHAAIDKRTNKANVALNRMVTGIHRVGLVLDEIGNDVEKVRAAWQNGDGGAVTTITSGPPRIVMPAPKFVAPVEQVRFPPKKAEVASDGPSDLSRPQQRILDALASFESLGIEHADKSNVGVFADQSPTSSAFANNLGRLRTLGLIAYPSGGRVALTDEGRPRARGDEIHTLAALHDAWQSKLPAPQWRILEVLIGETSHEMEREMLANESQQSATSSAYANNLGRLRTLGLIEYRRNAGLSVVYATELLFPKGLR